MADTWLQHMHDWQNFYLLLGTAAATLTGVMFVVVSLATSIIGASDSPATIRTFVTSTIVYFTLVLVLSALMLMPVLPSSWLSCVIALGGAGVIAYLVVAGAHTQWRRAKLGLDDWCWYVGLPSASGVLLLFTAWDVWFHVVLGLESASLAALLLTVTGVRNAWDIALWVAQKRAAHEGR